MKLDFSRIRRALWICVGILAVLGLGIVIGGMVDSTDRSGRQVARVMTGPDTQTPRRATPAEIAQAPGVIRTIGSIGGPFELIDQAGKPVTDRDLLGNWSLIYFGFTYCPDICPAELQTMARAMQSLPASIQETVLPVFITIDPERDTPKVMGEYVKMFDERMIGLTGTREQVRQAAEEYKVFYQRVEPEGSSAYLMDHSTFTYLVNPEGDVEAIFRYPADPQVMADVLVEEVATHRQAGNPPESGQPASQAPVKEQGQGPHQKASPTS